MKEEVITVEGEVLENLPNARFVVKIPNGKKIIGHLSGKMRQHYIKIITGDKVKIEINRYDLEKGRIVYRSK